MTAPAPAVSPELRSLLRRVKLGKLLVTLPERLALAKTSKLSHAEFLELVLADEVTRRDTSSAAQRARVAGLDPAMTMACWDDSAAVTYDRATWAEVSSLRFVEAPHNVVIMGPVGVGKTFLATALGHAAVRRRYRVHFERTDHLLRRLKASRLDNSHDAEIRKLVRVDVLILDDFALSALDATDTADIYEVIVERHRRSATVVTSNREPMEWLALMADPLLAQSAIDRLQSAAHELVLDGESYRRRQKRPGTGNTTSVLDPMTGVRHAQRADASRPRTRSHATGEPVVPCCWRATVLPRMMGPLLQARLACIGKACRTFSCGTFPKQSTRHCNGELSNAGSRSSSTWRGSSGASPRGRAQMRSSTA